MTRSILVALFCLAACGGRSATSDTPDAESGCPYGLDDPCIDEAALAQCEAAYAECGGDVSVMESCPLQFACP